MKRLSKEQANWLIEQFQIKWLGNDAIKSEAQDSLALSALKIVVSQCTEKEFPRLEFETELKTLVELRESIDDSKKISMSISWDKVKGALLSTDFTSKEFKAFTQGCIEICEWWGEQE